MTTTVMLRWSLDEARIERAWLAQRWLRAHRYPPTPEQEAVWRRVAVTITGRRIDMATKSLKAMSASMQEATSAAEAFATALRRGTNG